MRMPLRRSNQLSASIHAGVSPSPENVFRRAVRPGIGRGGARASRTFDFTIYSTGRGARIVELICIEDLGDKLLALLEKDQDQNDDQDEDDAQGEQAVSPKHLKTRVCVRAQTYSRSAAA
jgi:hypothetical protein